MAPSVRSFAAIWNHWKFFRFFLNPPKVMGFPLSPHSIRAAKWVTPRVPSDPFYAVVSEPSFPKLRCMIGFIPTSSSANPESMNGAALHPMVTNALAAFPWWEHLWSDKYAIELKLGEHNWRPWATMVTILLRKGGTILCIYGNKII